MTELANRDNMPTPFGGSDGPLAFGGWDGTLERAHTTQVSKGERLREWLDLFIKTEAVARVLAQTTFVPKQMQGKPAEVAAAMMRGFEMNVDPLDALAHMHVINGKVGYSAEFMRRRIIQAGHEILFPETTDSRAVVKARRREHNGDETKWQTFSFSEDNARKAKIDLGQYPADKLVARASSRMCRRMFPEVLAGADIAEDLLDAAVVDGGDLSGVDLDTAPAVGAVRAATAQRRRQPRTPKAQNAKTVPQVDDDLLDESQAPPSEPPNPPADSIIEESEASADERSETNDGDPITKPQLQKLSILRQGEGYGNDETGREGWFQWVEVNIGRRVESNKDLTKAEASVLIDVLEPTQETLT